MSKKKKETKKTRKTAKAKVKAKQVPVSALEKKSMRLFERLEQIRIALSISTSEFRLNQSSKGWTLRVKGWKPIRAPKLSVIVSRAEKKARSLI